MSSQLCSNNTTTQCLQDVMNGFNQAVLFKTSSEALLFGCSCIFLIVAIFWIYKGWGNGVDTSDTFMRLGNAFGVFLILASILIFL